jgi:hypothetical protein
LRRTGCRPQCVIRSICKTWCYAQSFG